MQSFKQFLKEEDTSHFYKTRKEIKTWVSRYVDNYHFKINEDNTVSGENVHNTIFLLDSMLVDGYLPVKFMSIDTLVINQYSHLKSLVGCPDIVNQSFTLTSNGKITSLIGGPKKSNGFYKIIDFNGLIKSLEGVAEEAHVYRLYMDAVTSYHNVHKHIKHIGSLIEISDKIESDLLGMIMIKGDFSIIQSTPNTRLNTAIDIINKHLSSEDRDIMDCREELVQKRLKEFAKL